MPRTIVVPLDRSDVSERALPLAEMLARQLDARLLLISVLEVPPDYAEWIDAHTVGAPWRKRHLEIEGYLVAVAGRIEGVPVTAAVLHGMDAAMEIDAAVTRTDDALLVMACQGKSGIKRLVLGSTTSRLVQLASYPLIVVPAACEETPKSISRILLPLDGSTFAEHAVEVALDIFKASDLSLHLLRVVDPVLIDTEIDVSLRTDLVENAGRYLETVADDLKARGYPVTWEVDESFDVANRIATAADENDSDLIALATHGRTGFSRLFFGSVADGVLRVATRPVLIVRPSEKVINRAPESRGPVTQEHTEPSGLS